MAQSKIILKHQQSLSELEKMEKVFCNEYLLTAINLIKIEAHEKAPDSLEKIERFCDQIFSRLSEEELKQYREYRANVTTIKL